MLMSGGTASGTRGPLSPTGDTMRALTILLLILVPASSWANNTPSWPPPGVECTGSPGFGGCTGFIFTQAPAQPIELKPAPGTAVSGSGFQANTPPLPPPPVVYRVDAKPFWDQVLWPIIGAVAMALVAWIVRLLTPYIGANAAKALDDRLTKAMQDGLASAQLQFQGNSLESFNVQNEVLAKALNYVAKHAGEDLKKAGVTDELLKEKLNAMLAPAIMLATAQPGMTTVAQVATQANPAIPTAPVNVNNKE